MLQCKLPFIILLILLFGLYHIVLHDWEMKLEMAKEKVGEKSRHDFTQKNAPYTVLPTE